MSITVDIGGINEIDAPVDGLVESGKRFTVVGLPPGITLSPKLQIPSWNHRLLQQVAYKPVVEAVFR
jgi:hypothetical protein